jgi:hypothetical protein
MLLLLLLLLHAKQKRSVIAPLLLHDHPDFQSIAKLHLISRVRVLSWRLRKIE